MEQRSSRLICPNCGWDSDDERNQCPICQIDKIEKGSVPLSKRSANNVVVFQSRKQYNILNFPKFFNHLSSNLTQSTVIPKNIGVPIFLIAFLVISGGMLTPWLYQTYAISSNDDTAKSLAFKPQQFQLYLGHHPGYIPFSDPKLRDELKLNDLGFILQVENDSRKSLNALNTGEADIILTSIVEFIRQPVKGKVVGLIERSSLNTIVVNTDQYPGIKTLNDLQYLAEQKRKNGQQLDLIFADNTSGEYLALRSLNLGDFQSKKVEANTLWTQVQNSSAAVVILPEPYANHAQQLGYTVIDTGPNEPLNITAIVASDALIKSNPESISRLLSVYYNRIDSSILDSTHLSSQLAFEHNYTEQEVANLLQNMYFYSSMQTLQAMDEGHLALYIDTVAATLKLSGRINKLPTATGLYTSQFMGAAANNTEKLVRALKASRQDDLVKRIASAPKNDALTSSRR
jgi:OmpA-OmpF porin, OOP family